MAPLSTRNIPVSLANSPFLVLGQALNAISTLTVHGLITDSNGANVPLELHRTDAPLDLVPPLDMTPKEEDEEESDPWIPRLPSTLPEPGTAHAHLALGERRGSG